MRADYKRRAIEASKATEGHPLGNAYLTAFGRWFRDNPDRPRLAKSMMVPKSGYPDPPRILCPDEICEAVGNMVLRLPDPQRDAVMGRYCRVRIVGQDYSERFVTVRWWNMRELAEKLGVSERTLWDRLASAKGFIEREAEAMGLMEPPY